MVVTKDSEPAPQVGQPPASAPPGVEPGAHTCPRHRWGRWRSEQPAQTTEGGAQAQQPRHVWHHVHHWHYAGPPQKPGDGQEWPPRDWQQRHHERRWHHGHCPWSSGRPSCGTGSRAPLDDSRWLEDYFAWY